MKKINKDLKDITNKKPILILLAAGTGAGKGTLISEIKDNLSFFWRRNLSNWYR